MGSNQESFELLQELMQRILGCKVLGGEKLELNFVSWKEKGGTLGVHLHCILKAMAASLRAQVDRQGLVPNL